MRPWPWWSGAVAEAVGLISYERNQDRIIGSAYVSASVALIRLSENANPDHVKNNP